MENEQNMSKCNFNEKIKNSKSQPIYDMIEK